MMKKKLYFIGTLLVACTIIAGSVILVKYADQDNVVSNLFMFQSVKRVRGKDGRDIAELQQEALSYEKDLQHKVEVADKLGNVYQNLGEKYLAHNNWTSAIESFEKALGYGNDNPLLLHQLGVAYANRGYTTQRSDDFQKSEVYYEKAISKNQNLLHARYGLAIMLFYGKKEQRKAVKVLKRLVVDADTYYRAKFALARMYYEMNKPARALSLYENIYADVEKLPDSSENKSFKENARKNIDRLMSELSVGSGK